MDLCLIAATPFSWTSLSSWFAMLQMAVGLGFVIFVHELGHFMVAKLCGVKCEKFYIGFDMFDIKIGDLVIVPRTLLKMKWGETEYGIGIIPLGGYVKMLGQDDNPARAEEERKRSLRVKEDAETADEDAFELDPRSYQAKSVWQRMMIISAGVVMNLIFAVVFASIAYGIGVSYQQSIIGSTVPGGPAWERNIRPGDRIVAIGKNLEEREHLRFRDDVTSAIVYNGAKRDIRIGLQPYRRSDRREVFVRPSVKVIKQKTSSAGFIGIGSAQIPVLAVEKAVQFGTSAYEISQDGEGFLPGDRIVRLDDQDISDVHAMREYLAIHSADTVKFVVERENAAGETTTASFDVPPNPMRTVGLMMEYGPILAIQDDSPAAASGLVVGDLLLEYDGQPVGDPITLSPRLRKLAEKEIELTIERDGKNETIKITPRQPYTSNNFNMDFDQRIAVDELGIAFAVTNKVASVVPGSPADRQGMQAGDVLTKIEFDAASAEQQKMEEEELGFGESQNSFEFADAPNGWPAILDNVIQNRLPDTAIVLHYVRGDEEKSAKMFPESSAEFFLDRRGIMLQPDEKIHVAASFGEAVKLGFRQTWEDSTKIYGLLYKLVSGEVSPINLGGPVTIGRVATYEALSGPSHFLLFLTLLSANLAIVNFLPIPILDGGHMVFLIYEAIFKKPISEKLQVIFSFGGLIFIVGLMLMVISLDVWRLFEI